MKPVIGMVANTFLNRFKMPASTVPLAYTNSIERAGGIPVVLPFTREVQAISDLVRLCHGFVLPGGSDVDPGLYGEPPSPQLGETDRTLDDFQTNVFRAAMALERPILGICRGCQVINVALGGTLVQDIPTQFPDSTIGHMQKIVTFDTDHWANLEPGSRLHDLWGPRIRVNSLHHQAIKIPGRDLVVTAWAPDGVAEAAQHTRLPIDLVQWHPELMMQKNDDMLGLFESLVDRCKP
jgi:putative glutamine amidotransferase